MTRHDTPHHLISRPLSLVRVSQQHTCTCVQGKGPTDKYGDWPVRYKAIPCPVGKLTMRFQFLDFSKPVRIPPCHRV